MRPALPYANTPSPENHEWPSTSLPSETSPYQELDTTVAHIIHEQRQTIRTLFNLFSTSPQVTSRLVDTKSPVILEQRRFFIYSLLLSQLNVDMY